VVSQAAAAVVAEVPGHAKLIGLTFGADPGSESVGILVRERSSLSGFRVEWRPLPDPSTIPDPPWMDYFAFGAEPALPEGTRVQIFSGIAADAPPREPGTTQRFVATTASEAAVHFSGPGVELRVVNGMGTVVHQRQFLTDDAYAPLPMSAIRKVDGTALFLMLSTGAITAPTLRLAFTLTRNLGAVALEAPVLRQAGSDGPEAVGLDLQLE
jgi:hypothetical protein